MVDSYVSLMCSTKTGIIKWDDQHDVKKAVRMQRSRDGKRESVAACTFYILSGEGYLLGFMHRQGNSISETYFPRLNILRHHTDAQVDGKSAHVSTAACNCDISINLKQQARLDIAGSLTRPCSI